MSTALPLLFQQIPHWIFVVWIPESQKTGEFLNTRETPASPNLEAAGSKS